MATKKKTTKKTTKKVEVAPVEEKIVAPVEEIVAPVEEKVEETPVIEEEIKKEEKPVKKEKKSAAKGPKYPIGSIVFLSKDVSADLNGFKIFPQYKKDTYTVEAYDQNTGVYTLRRLKLLIRLQEGFLVAPDERAHDAVNRKQF